MFNAEIISLLKASLETLYMVFVSSFISIMIGLVLGCILFVTNRKNTLSNKYAYRVVGFCLNMIRSLPFIILMIMLIPFTRLIVGTTIGTGAAIVPLTIAAIPFYTRICENALALVPEGLMEAAHAMGATTFQMITKILLPESKASLIRGATLTVIGLIGYSAMAGVVGGGGLGELAINYGYQRFNVVVMLETVILLIILVQIIQLFGDYLAKHRHIKSVFISSIFLSVICLVYQWWPASFHTQHSLRVGVMSGWSEDVMQVAALVAQQQYGIEMHIVPFSDYAQPNVALNNRSIDVNVFQHLPYLEAQIKAKAYHLVPIAKTFVYPMGFFSKKIKFLSQLKEGAIVAIPNDPSNGSRALLLLQKSGLIKLKPKVGILATLNDITSNQHNLQFKLLDAAQLARSLNDADLVAITNDFLNATGLTIQQAILKEDSDSPYANLIVVNEKDKDSPMLAKFVSIMHSKPVLEKTKYLFPHGAAIPAWKDEGGL